MSYYPALKQRLTCREVAPRYGLKVNTSGMALCPFHDEHSPSLKLSRGFHCFGCGAQGDVITFAKQETRVEKVNANRTEVFLRPFTPARQRTEPQYQPKGKQRVWTTAKMFSLSCEKCANKR